MARNRGPLAAPRGSALPTIADRVGDLFYLTTGSTGRPPGLYWADSTGNPSVWRLLLTSTQIGTGLEWDSVSAQVKIRLGDGLEFDGANGLRAYLASGGGLIFENGALKVDPSVVGSGGSSTTTVLPPRPIVTGNLSWAAGNTTGPSSAVTRTFVGGLYLVTFNGSAYRVGQGGVFATYLQIDGADVNDVDGVLVQSLGMSNEASSHRPAVGYQALVQIAAGSHSIRFRPAGGQTDNSDFASASFQLVSAAAQPAGSSGGWQTATLGTGWSGTARYRRTADGTIVLEGIPSRSGGGGVGTVLFTLPDGFRPSGTRTMDAMIGNTGYPNGALQIFADGRVQYSDGPALSAGGYLSLDRASFTAADGPTNVAVAQGDAIVTTLPPRPVIYSAMAGTNVWPTKSLYFTGGLYRVTASIELYGASTGATAAYPQLDGANMLDVDGVLLQNFISLGQAGIRTTPAEVSGLVQITPGNHNVAVTLSGNGRADSASPAFITFELVSPAPSPAGMTTPGVAPTLAAPWAEFQAGGGSFAPVSYSRNGDGEVQLSGMVSGGSTGNPTIFTLPVGFRPPRNRYFGTMYGAGGGNGFGYVAVLSTGEVQYQVGPSLAAAGSWTALDEISFLVEGAPQTRLSPANVAPEKVDVLPLVLSAGWSQYPGTFSALGVWKGGDNQVRFRGLLQATAANANGTLIATLPPGYRPAAQTVLDLSNSASAQSGRIDVYPDGRMLYVGNGAATQSGQFFPLDGLNFVVAEGPKAPGVRIGPIENAKAVVLPPSLGGGVTQYGTTFEEVEVWKDADGRVHVEGLLRGASGFANNSLILTLPAGYRPAAQRVLKAMGNGGLSRLDVYPSGEIRLNGTLSGDSYIELDLHFMAAGGPVQAAVALGYVGEPIEVATLPTSPANGTVVDLVLDATKGLVYRCKYDERISGNFKWRVLGNPRAFASDFRTGPLAANTAGAWAILSSSPAAASLPRGVFRIDMSGSAYSTSGGPYDASVTPRFGNSAASTASADSRLVIGAPVGFAQGGARSIEINNGIAGTSISYFVNTAGPVAFIDLAITATPIAFG